MTVATAGAAPPSASTVPAGSSAAGGTAGSAAAGGTSASTLGVGATTTGPSGTDSAIGTGGSAAGGTHDLTKSHVNGNADNLHGMSKAQAQDGGIWSHSMTHTTVHQGEVISRTRSMSHEPGGPPTKSTSTIDTAATPQ
ncbi:MAG: hypothetical protein JO032_04255 [Alphaproteobacteria bacterium]|nr:hypothetical protein [Alphaproteobacteria bacterium]MBV9551989.1 hypothetical protein [Alphaproteobacteria bacterium]